jgi:hypothetical protein
LILTSLLTAYIDDDYPDPSSILHPGLPYVALCVEDSEHYLIRAPEGSAPEHLAQIEAEFSRLDNGFIPMGPHGCKLMISRTELQSPSTLTITADH